MNRKQLLLLIILVLVLGGLGLFVFKKQAASYTSSGGSLGQKVLGDFPVNDVAQVQIKQPGAEVSLAKKEETWRVVERYDYPADFSALAEMLRKLADLKFVQREEIGPSQWPRLQLVAPGSAGAGTNAGTLVELKDKNGKVLKGLLLGKKHMRQGQSASPFGEDGGWPDGRYLMVANDPQRLGLISDPLSNVEAKPEQWLSKEFFKVEKIKSVSVTSTNATNQWKISRETEGGEMKMADLKDLKPNEQFDPAKASGLGYLLSSPSFVDVVAPDKKPEETGMVNPLVATIQTFDNLTYIIKIGSKTNDENFYLNMAVKGDLAAERASGKEEKPEDKEKLDKEYKEKQKKLEEKLKQEKSFEKWTYLVSKWTIDPLLKGRGEFFSEKKEEPKKEEPKTSGLNLPTNGVVTPPPAPPLPGAIEGKSEKPAPPAPVEKPAAEKPAPKAEEKSEKKPEPK